MKQQISRQTNTTIDIVTSCIHKLRKKKNSRSFFGVAEWNTILTGGDGSWQRSEGRRELNEPSVLGAARNCFEAMEAAAIEIKTKKELKKKML